MSDSDQTAEVDADGYTLLERASEYETGWYTGGYDLLEQPDGSTKKYYWAALPDAVSVVAIDGDDLLFTRQYRPAAEATFLECPAGIVEANESFEAAAARELREETGFAADECTCIQTLAVANGVLRHQRGIVVAEGLTDTGEDNLDTNEFLSVERVPRADAVAQARTQPASGATLEALLLAQADGYI